MSTYAEIMESIKRMSTPEFNIIDDFMKAQRHFRTGGTTGRLAAPFKVGDLIEFHSRAGALIRARVNRVNGKTVSCQQVDAPFGKWRVSPSLAHLVGADKMGTPVTPSATDTADELADVMDALPPPMHSSVPTAEAAGHW